MTAAKKLAGILGPIFFALWPMTALGGHPLLTEDTGTQGAGHYQLELTYDSNHQEDSDTESREQIVNAVLSIGILENLDYIVTLPYEHVSERTGNRTTAEGIADAEIAVKWRFYEDEALSLALRPALGLPTGNEGEGLGSDHIIPSLFAVMSYAADPWSFHLHLGYTRNFHDGAGERKHIYHASVAAEYSLDDSLRLVGDASLESNADQSGDLYAGSMVLGLVYSPTPDLDLDLGYRKGLTDAAPDHAWLAGLALRF
jgi:hypothetical protein